MFPIIRNGTLNRVFIPKFIKDIKEKTGNGKEKTYER